MIAERLAADAPARPALAQQALAVDQPERPYDLWLLGTVLAMLSLGTVEIYASTASAAFDKYGDPTYFLKRQIVFLGLGGFAMWIGATFDYRRLYRLTYPLLLLALGLLAAVQAMPAINGARRWILLGPLSFQPVELAKLALITYLAYSLRRKEERVKSFTVGFVPHLVVCSLMMGLLLMQPDLGSSIILGVTTLAMLFVAGARISYIVLAVLAAAPVAYQLVVGTPWRMQRFMAYFNPEAFSSREAYQFLQARLAIGSGGLTGVGLGESRQSLGYMPEGHNDFILAPIGEELGFIGVAIVLVLFTILLWRGVRAALGARDIFGGYLAFGVTMMFALQALLNVGVVLGVVPNKGITLPLVSYGGTSLVFTMFLIGLLLNVGRRPLFAPRGRSLAQPGLSAARRKRARVRVVA
ncbi:MAG: putative lipid II flippase FtsW [Kofleriaceae bacterium]|nr:putative lipid II flippase FtsW [Myxococcales bacterium]MCB9559363.1 putative lipid II flippase FtsW [Kofleriaceae bacterium]MCB9574047.1 putative lipid II flippase FtsW [Kofleriaceae bacterium]